MASNKSSKPFKRGQKLEPTMPLTKLSDFHVVNGSDKGTP
jgi:hypothetical protein